MSRLEKLKERLLSRPKDFTFDEMVSLLNKLGYQERKLGKTPGSRMAFFRQESQSIIRIHKPHPGNIIKLYVIDMLIEVLRKEDLL
jgi:hypothetical protein